MRERGTVISVQNETAIVQLNRGEKCDGCTVCQAFGESKMQLQALNRIHAGLGDDVDVEIESRHVVRNSLLIFILPLIMMIIGYFVALQFSPNKVEGVGILGSFFALALCLIILRLVEARKTHLNDDAVIVAQHQN